MMSKEQLILTSLPYTNTTGLNFYHFLQVAISTTENHADLRGSSHQTLTLRCATKHMNSFVRPVKALWSNFGLYLVVHL